MRIPGAERAVIAPEELRDYLLDESHDVGQPKARFFARLGYDRENWQQLGADLRNQHLILDSAREVPSTWGRRFILEALLTGPVSGGLVRSVWEIGHGQEVPRLITAYPIGHDDIETA